MTPTAYQRAAARTPTSASPSASARLAPSWSRAAARASAPSLLGDDPDELVRDLQDRFPERQPDRRRSRNSSGSSPRSSASSRRRASVSTFRSTCAARPSSSASGRRCAEIPAGETASYAEIARRIGEPKAVRAVAQACGANKIAVAIPCHRVVQKRRRALRLSLGRGAQARPAREGGQGMNAPTPRSLPLSRSFDRPRNGSARYDWQALSTELGDYGCAVIDKLLTPDECAADRGALSP